MEKKKGRGTEREKGRNTMPDVHGMDKETVRGIEPAGVGGKKHRNIIERFKISLGKGK